jgi:hypothetical protein
MREGLGELYSGQDCNWSSGVLEMKDERNVWSSMFLADFVF